MQVIFNLKFFSGLTLFLRNREPAVIKGPFSAAMGERVKRRGYPKKCVGLSFPLCGQQKRKTQIFEYPRKDKTRI